MALMRCPNVSGGGSGVVSGDKIKINGVEASATTAASQEFTVETGLSSIKHFALMAHPSYSYYTAYRQVVIYDSVSNKYDSACIYTGGAFGNSNNAIGTASNERAFTIKSISGGTITLRTGSTDAYYSACDNFYWLAD